MSPYLGVNNSSNLVFKYFFIYKITYIKNNFENSEQILKNPKIPKNILKFRKNLKKIRKIRKNLKITKKSENSEKI